MTLPAAEPIPAAPGDEASNGEVSPAQMQALARINALASRLERDAIRLVGQRQTIEERWLEDLRNYNGHYDDKTIQRIRSNEGSEVFVNITRPKSHTAESRLSDMLFPTDDKNWAISPTPVPTLQADLDNHDVLNGPDGQPIKLQDGQSATMADAVRVKMADAKRRSALMSDEIEDQLDEADYQIKARQVIHDGVVVGTGILKGPIVVGRVRQRWKKLEPKGLAEHVKSIWNRVRGAEAVYVLDTVVDNRPAVERVDPWNFFPDMAAAELKDCRFIFERRYLNVRDILRMREDPYYIRANLDRVLAMNPRQTHLSRHPTNEKRESAYNSDGETVQQVENEQYEVWEYHGPITPEDLSACGCSETDDDGGRAKELSGCVVFCGGIVMKAYVNPLETGEHPYSVFNYERDESCVFGYGVPFRARNGQRVLNAAWRALMDNTALSNGPQIIVNKSLVAPETGDYRLTPRKTWVLTDRNRNVNECFGLFDIPNHQAELQAIIELALRFVDQETNLPLITQGEAGPQVTKTAAGMTLLMNSANAITRATVKNWDDGITTPLIKRFYDWNMQNSPRADIKGDFEVDARGSSVLLSKEVQAQNLMSLAAQFAPSPIFGPMTKAAELYRKTVQAMHIAADDIVKTDQDIQADQQRQQQAAQGQSQDPRVAVEQMRQQGQAQMSALQHQQRMDEMRQEERLELIRMAHERNMSMDELRGQLAQTQLEIHGKRQEIADETRVKVALGSGI